MWPFKKQYVWFYMILIMSFFVIVIIFQNAQYKYNRVNAEVNTEVISESITEVPTEISTEQSTETHAEASIEVSTEVSTEALTDASTVEPYVRPFAEYIEQNTDFVGWITVEGTSIDAPLVQSVDNEYYLIHDYTGARNITGAIFMDYKNLGNFYDNHMSLYGHYMTDGTIFHDLHHFKDRTFFENNDTITIQGLRETKEYEIFSVHVVSAYTYYLYLDLKDEALLEYAKHFQRQSMFKKDVIFPKDLSLLTLVTCTYEYDNARILIHAFAKQ